MLYRCCFLDANDNIDAIEEIDAGSLLDAIEQANAMLSGRSHHSAVELVNRLEKTGAVKRHTGEQDRRQVWVRLTASGRALLRRLALAHREELERTGPELARA